MRSIRSAFTISTGLVVAAISLSLTSERTYAAVPEGQFGARYVVVQPPAVAVPCTREPLSGSCRQGTLRDPVRFLAGSPRLPSSASRTVAQVKCPGQQLGAVCGTVRVPLDRKDPKGRHIAIFFELFVHYGAGPAVSAILWNPGGPGSGTTDPVDTYRALSLMSENLDVHDVLLIDDRGRGYSGTISCHDMQHSPRPLADAVSDCAAQLGQNASRYGTGDIAQDTDAVRAALGYEKIDYYGQSYGGMDAAGYVTRFRAHVRSVVLDAPAGTPTLSQFYGLHFGALSEARKVTLACMYSPTCSADHANPDASLDWLIRRLRLSAVVGTGYDAYGNALHVRVDEAALLNLILNTTGYFVSTGEVVAAATSLRQGDSAPLLRLGAEAYAPFPPPGGFGNPAAFSAGAYGATYCMDNRAPFDWSVPPPQRLAQYANAVAELPQDYFAPFSKGPVTAIPYNLDRICVWWERPTLPSPVTPPHPIYPNVPTLVLSGTMDDSVPTELVAKDAQLFPNSAMVVVAGAGHITSGYSHCALNLASQFIETRRVGDTRCAKAPEIVAPAVARFPVLAKDAIVAAIDPRGPNRVGVPERKAVTVAVAAATDALKRSTFGSGRDHCLRAGTFETSYGTNVWTTTLRGCAFSADVIVSGTVTWGPSRSLAADLSLSGSGTAGGILHVIGTWQAKGPVDFLRVSGMLGGRTVALLVPEA